MMKIYIFLFLAVLALLSLSCQSSDEDAIIPSSPEMSQPIVTGLYITSAMGPEAIGTWGNPAEGSLVASNSVNVLEDGIEMDSPVIVKRIDAVSPPPYIPNGERLYIPYPNPSDGSCMINFTVPKTSNVVLFIVPARWAGDKSNDVYSSAGGTTVAPQRTAAAVLLRQQCLPGMHACTWSPNYPDANRFPAGFYRIYLRVENNYYWQDVYLYREITDLPAGLRRY